MATTVVNVYKTQGFKSVAAYDATNGNTVVNNLDIPVRVALTNDGVTIVDGTVKVIPAGGSVDYALGLTATDIVVFNQDTGSLINPVEVIAK